MALLSAITQALHIPMDELLERPRSRRSNRVVQATTCSDRTAKNAKVKCQVFQFIDAMNEREQWKKKTID
ncbi:MAG: hypothetical protein ACYC9L_12580 [Sulfuricaulis sp.]